MNIRIHYRLASVRLWFPLADRYLFTMNFREVIGLVCLGFFTTAWLAEASERTVIPHHSSVNIRSGAGTKNALVGKIDDKEEAQVIGRKVLKLSLIHI